MGNLGYLAVSWHSRGSQGFRDPEPYAAFVFGRQPKNAKQFRTSEEAKRWCERAAVRMIKSALDAIEWNDPA